MSPTRLRTFAARGRPARRPPGGGCVFPRLRQRGPVGFSASRLSFSTTFRQKSSPGAAPPPSTPDGGVPVARRSLFLKWPKRKSPRLRSPTSDLVSDFLCGARMAHALRHRDSTGRAGGTLGGGQGGRPDGTCPPWAASRTKTCPGFLCLERELAKAKGAIVPEVTGSPRWPGSLREIRWLCRGAGGGVWRAPWYRVASACFALTAWCRGR